MDDAEAVRRLKRREIGGLEPLVARYQLQALRAAYLVTRDRCLAEDVVQEAFVRLNQRVCSFEDSRPFAPWFLRTVVNDAIKAVDQGKRFVSLDGVPEGEHETLAGLLPSLELGPEELAEQAEVEERVWSAVGELSPAQRAAVVRRYYLGLTEGEIAVASGRSVGTVKRLLFTGRRRLRLLLAGVFPEYDGPANRGS